MRYRRLRVAGGEYFFTAATYDRRPVFTTEAAVGHLRAAIRAERRRRPFEIVAMVVLPDHLHAVWRLPADDSAFPTRWRAIKAGTTQRLRRAGLARGRVWQDRYWEHWLRDERDARAHVDYIHANPVRHGLVADAADWPWSSLHAWIRAGAYADGRIPDAASPAPITGEPSP